MTVGALFGLFIGLVFTVVPLVVAWIVVRLRSQRRTWKGWLGWLVVVALTATPNLMTLGIVTGSSNGAHAGDRILDVDGAGIPLVEPDRCDPRRHCGDRGVVPRPLASDVAPQGVRVPGRVAFPRRAAVTR